MPTLLIKNARQFMILRSALLDAGLIDWVDTPPTSAFPLEIPIDISNLDFLTDNKIIKPFKKKIKTELTARVKALL